MTHNSMVEETDDLEIERYELTAAPVYRFAPSRREFAQVLGAGILVVSCARTTLAQRRRGRDRPAATLAERFHLGNEGTITILTSKVEVGQGSRTQITQAVAEELRVPVGQVQVLMADTAIVPDDGGTAGSRTTPATIPTVRRAAAALRELLLTEAASRLGVPAAGIDFAEGAFRTTGSHASVSLKELIVDRQKLEGLDLPPQTAELTATESWKVLGTPVAKVGGLEVVTGQAQYPSDIRLPGMRYGKVLRPPSFGAKLTVIDLQAADGSEGITVVRDGGFVGCVADSSWQASQALDALAKTAQWVESAEGNSEELFDHFKATARLSGSGRGGPRTREWGDASAQPAENPRRVKLSVTIPYIQHAPMEPRAAVAEWSEEKLTVWTGSQQPARVKSELQAVFRLGDSAVRVIVPDTGGGFGGKHTGEVATEAARLSKAADKPVSLRWTREEEFTWAYFRPAGLIEVDASLDDEGKLDSWSFDNYNSGGSALESPYEIARGRVRFIPADSPLRQGSYRALASTANNFAREVAMDSLAELAKVSPLEFRLQHLPAGRLRDVLVTATRNFDHVRTQNKSRAGTWGTGIACGTEKGSFVAALAEVEIQGKNIRVQKVTQAFECGTIQNPLNLRNQVSGCIMMGMGGALWEEILFAKGKIRNPSFSQYQVPRMSDLPELEVLLVDRLDLPSVGAGETPIIAIAPAIANAIYDAVGIRLHSLPLRLG